MISTQRLFSAFLASHDLSVREVYREIMSITVNGNFRSDMDPPSAAKMLQPKGKPVPFPSRLPYVAGWVREDRIRATAMVIDERVRWFSESNEKAIIVVRRLGGAYPRSVVDSMMGRDAAEIVGHPLFEGQECIIQHAHCCHDTLQLTIFNHWERAVDRTEESRAA